MTESEIDEDYNLSQLFSEDQCLKQFYPERSPLFESESRDASLSFDMWETSRVDNIAKRARKSKRLLKLRLELLRRVSELLDELQVNWCVYGGTALSIYRENGKFIAHDSDVDLALEEQDFGKVWKALHREHESENGLLPSRLISWSSKCYYTGETWAYEDEEANLHVKSFVYQKSSVAKYFKFHLTPEAWREFGHPKLGFNRDDVHLDLFTLGQSPEDSNYVICNWVSFPRYDPLKHTWPYEVFWPARCDASFEGITVKAPRNIEAYLRGEYGYLGKPAVYDCALQLYVPVPVSVFDTFPEEVKKLFAG